MADGQPCARCVSAHDEGHIRAEAIQPVPPAPPTAKDGSGPCCHDCVAAETLVRLQSGLDFGMARTAIGNDRMESMRLPGIPLGTGLIRPSQEGDLERHFDWLHEHDLVW